jgi:protein SCO1/2
MAMTRFQRLLDGVRDFITGGGFPAFALALLLCWELFLIGMLLVPPSPSALGAFAEDFRVWCFGYDPATGRTEWAYVMAMILPQILMGLFIALFWWNPLLAILKRPRVLALHLGAAGLLVAGASAGFAFSGGPSATGDLPFPAEELRTAYHAPQLRLGNHLGESVDLAALQGDVVMLTAIYASCGHTCPAILTQAKGAIAQLAPEEREDLRVLAVTLDPEHDSPEVLARLAGNHGMQAPLYHMLTGAPTDVERVLDRMQVARQRDPETGVITHANLFLLIDSLGERQQRWLVSALRVLLKEEGAVQ